MFFVLPNEFFSFMFVCFVFFQKTELRICGSNEI
uniref:Uncharacterized protein n=1 Tax=Anguilla anguilla TaxID=7936 RepID=A0A0E9RMI6_ANGAN